MTTTQPSWKPFEDSGDPIPAPPRNDDRPVPSIGERDRIKVEDEDAIELAELIAAIDATRDAETTVEYDDPQQWKKRHV